MIIKNNKLFIFMISIENIFIVKYKLNIKIELINKYVF